MIDFLRLNEQGLRQNYPEARSAFLGICRSIYKVYFASAAPAVVSPNVYGIDMPAANELIAHGRTVEEVREEIGADWLVYQDLEDLIECSREGNPEVDGFESSVFDGQYLAGNIDDQYLQSIEAARADGAKGRGPFLGASDGAVVGLHNDN